MCDTESIIFRRARTERESAGQPIPIVSIAGLKQDCRWNHWDGFMSQWNIRYFRFLNQNWDWDAHYFGLRTSGLREAQADLDFVACVFYSKIPLQLLCKNGLGLFYLERIGRFTSPAKNQRWDFLKRPPKVQIPENQSCWNSLKKNTNVAIEWLI